MASRPPPPPPPPGAGRRAPPPPPSAAGRRPLPRPPPQRVPSFAPHQMPQRVGVTPNVTPMGTGLRPPNVMPQGARPGIMYRTAPPIATGFAPHGQQRAPLQNYPPQRSSQPTYESSLTISTSHKGVGQKRKSSGAGSIPNELKRHVPASAPRQATYAPSQSIHSLPQQTAFQQQNNRPQHSYMSFQQHQNLPPKTNLPLKCGNIDVEDLAGKSETQKIVQDHYDEINKGIVEKKEREASRIIYLRHFNNWVKTVVIEHHLQQKPNAYVLDLCGGKFGDLPKWLRAWENEKLKHVTLVDHSWNSVKEAGRRYNEKYAEVKNRKMNRRDMFSADFVVADCFRARISDIYDDGLYFDLVSAQFSIHYAFESEKRVRALLKNISDRLKDDGFFVATIPDANVLVKMFREACKPDSKYASQRHMDGTVVFGNEFYKVEFVGRTENDTEFPASDPYGIKYKFLLEDSVDDCIEYLVHVPTFLELAREYGLKLRQQYNFEEFYRMMIRAPGERTPHHVSFEKMVLQKLKSRHEFPKKLWEIAHLYLVIIFDRTHNKSTDAQESTYEKEPKMMKKSDILVIRDVDERDPMEEEENDIL